MCGSGYVNVLQWNREWFYSRRVEFDSGFNVMAVYEVFWHGPEVINRFTGIRKRVVRWWKRPFWFSKKIKVTFSSNWSLPYQGGCFQVLISSKVFDSPICDWLKKISRWFAEFEKLPPCINCSQHLSCMFVSFRVLTCVCLGPSVQRIPPDFAWDILLRVWAATPATVPGSCAVTPALHVSFWVRNPHIAGGKNLMRSQFHHENCASWGRFGALLVAVKQSLSVFEFVTMTRFANKEHSAVLAQLTSPIRSWRWRVCSRI